MKLCQVCRCADIADDVATCSLCGESSFLSAPELVEPAVVDHTVEPELVEPAVQS